MLKQLFKSFCTKFQAELLDALGVGTTAPKRAAGHRAKTASKAASKTRRGPRLRRVLKTSRKSARGQIVLEMAFMLPFVMFLIVVAWFFYSLFEISQKQTMLVRQQAFIELGGFGEYSGGRPGKEHAKDGASQVLFRLGQSSQHTMVDLSKVKSFYEHMKGDLVVDITPQVSGTQFRSALHTDKTDNDDDFWAKYRLPKGQTKLVWRQSKNSASMMEMDFAQTSTPVLAIAHNRSIDLNDKGIKKNVSIADGKTGAYSGSITFANFVKLNKLSENLPTLKGLTDNAEALKAAVRQIGKDDPSLALDAEKLEKKINGSEVYSGSVKAAAISMAIQIAMQLGMQALSDAFSSLGPPPDAAKEAALDAQRAANNPLSVFGHMFDPQTAGASIAQGDMITGPLASLAAPVEMPMEALSGENFLTGEVTGGGLFQNLADLGKGAADFSTLADLGSDLSMLGQTVQTGMSYAGKSLGNTFDVAVTALGAPKAIQAGIKTFTDARDTVNTATGFSKLSGEINGIQQMVAPTTALLGKLAPDLTAPLNLVNTASSIVAAGTGAIAGAFSPDKDLNALQNIGKITMNVGIVTTGVQTIAGKDPALGGYLTMAGGGMYALGTAAAEIRKLKPDGDIKLSELPGLAVEGVGNMVKKNFDNAGNMIGNFGKNMSMAGDRMQSGIEAMGQRPDDRASNIAAGLTKVRNETDNLGKRLGDASFAGGNNIQAMKDYSNSAIDAINKSMQANAADPAKIAELQSVRTTIQQGLDHMQTIRADGSPADNAILQQTADATARLKQLYDENVQNSPVAHNYIRAMRSDVASVKELHDHAIQNGQTIAQIGQMEKDRTQGNPWKLVLALKGTDRTNDVYRAQKQDDAKVASFAQIDKRVMSEVKERNSTIEQTRNLVRASEKISKFGPQPDKDQAAQAAMNLRLMATKPDIEWSPQEQTRIVSAAQHLEDIAAGNARFLTGAEKLAYYNQQVDQREEYFQRMKVVLQEEAALLPRRMDYEATAE